MEYKSNHSKKYTHQYASSFIYKFWALIICVALVIYLYTIFFPSSNVSIDNPFQTFISKKGIYFILTIGLVSVGLMFHFFCKYILTLLKIRNSEYIGEMAFWWFLFLAVVIYTIK